MEQSEQLREENAQLKAALKLYSDGLRDGGYIARETLEGNNPLRIGHPSDQCDARWKALLIATEYEETHG